MYTIDRTTYGLFIEVRDSFSDADGEQWEKDIQAAVNDINGEFSVFANLRRILLISPESKNAVQTGEKYACEHGLVRSVMILGDDVTLQQLRGIARRSGTYKWERYIDANAEPNWEKIGLDWVIHAIDPDKRPQDTKTTSHESA